MKHLTLLSLSAVAVSNVANAQNTKTEQRPNILLIICDDLIDYQGIYGGHPASKTPNLDRLTKESVRFTNAHSIAPVSAPCRAALFTGIYPHVSGNLYFDPWFNNTVLSNSKTLMSHLRESGYQAYGTGKLLHRNLASEYSQFGLPEHYGPLPWNGTKAVPHPSIPPKFGAVPSIGPVDGTFASLADVPEVDGYRGWFERQSNKPFRYVNDDDRDLMRDEEHTIWAANKLSELAKNQHNDPFYLAVGYVRPHTPLVVPQKFFDRFPLESVEVPEWVEGDADDTYYKDANPGSRGYLAFNAMKEAYGENIREGFRKYLQAYLACVNFVDEEIGKLLNALDNSPFADNTIVIMTSDHGYDFGQKEHFFKNSLWETSTSVPFLVRLPKKQNAGKSTSHPVSLIDIYPTLVDYCGITSDNRKNENGARLCGYTLRELLERPEANQWSGSPVALSFVMREKKGGGYPPDASLLPQDQNYSVRSKDWRYIRYATGQEELYYHVTDRGEVTNLADHPAHQEVKKQLIKELYRLVPQLNEKR